jgi:chromosome partitioning protein
MTTPIIIAIANQKGGVGKTTTAINLAAALVESGAKVMLLDLDPQGNSSTGLGINSASRIQTTYDILINKASVSSVALITAWSGLFVCPANADLASADIDLVKNERRSYLLRDALHGPDIASMGLNFILIDCPPSLSLLTLNAFIASNSVLVPLQSEFFALEGLSQLMVTIREVRQSANPVLRIEGVLLTMVDARNRLSQQVEADARATLGDLVFSTVIPRNVRLSEAPSFAQPVLVYDTSSKGAESYRALAAEVLRRHPLKQ